MKELQGRPVVRGEAKGTAVVSSQPINLLASFAKVLILRRKRGIIGDKNHPLLGRDVKDKILVIPQTIGSTTGGIVLLEALKRGIAPRAVVCEKADSLLVSGAVLGDVWYGISMPVVDGIPWQELSQIKDGQTLEITKEGVIRII